VNWLREQLSLTWKRMPCPNIYKYALVRLESQQINEQFRDWTADGAFGH
jgi:hypothetical protein